MTALSTASDLNHLFASAMPREVERRSALRIEAPFPAIIRGRDTTGQRFELHTPLDNLSAAGLYVRLQPLLQPGVVLFIVVQLARVGVQREQAPGVAIRGVILRADALADGQFNACARTRRLNALTTSIK